MKRLAPALFALLSAMPAMAQDERVGLRVREWYARMSGTAEAASQGLGATSIDLANDLGLGNRNWDTELQAYLAIPVLGRLYAGWWRARDSGDITLSQQIDFAGETFTAGTPVHSEFTLDVGYLNYEFAFPTIPLGDLMKLELGVGIGVQGIRGEGSIAAAGLSASDSGTVAFPTVGAHAILKMFNFVRTEVEVRGMGIKYSNYEIHYLEAFAEATVEPLPWIFAGVGYKIAQINFERTGGNTVKLNVDLDGVYFTVGVRF
jgi:hypothetical protein